MLSDKMLIRSKILANNIKRYMEVNGFTQRQLADLAGISFRTLNNWLCHVAYPSSENLLRLAEALQCEVPDLTEEETYLDTRRRYLTVAQSSVLNAYSTDLYYQQICDIALKLLRKNRLAHYLASWIELIHTDQEDDT